MNAAMIKALTDARQHYNDRLGPEVHENVFWALRQAGIVDDSGFVRNWPKGI